MPLSSAEELEQAREDVQRIGQAIYEEVVRQSGGAVVGTWEGLTEGTRRRYISIATTLLQADVIRVGRRPERPEPPMTGQEAMALDSLGRA